MDAQVLTMLVSQVGGLGLFAYVVWRQLVIIAKRMDDHLTKIEKQEETRNEVLQGVVSLLAILEERTRPITDGATPVFGIRPVRKPR